jgi:3-oxoacyl-[acyl-carrier protein] reductase/pteridine reductase
MAAYLTGKVALVTGAGKRIGRSIALRLASDGADIAVNYLSSWNDAEAVAVQIRALGRRSLTIQADVSRKSEVEAMFAAVEREFGRLDILINNAGIFFREKFEELTEDQWDHIMTVNLKSQMLCSQAAAPLMRRNETSDGATADGVMAGGEAAVKGRIINLASLGGLLPWPAYTHYCVSKAGVIMLSRCLARALAPDILVNAVAPGTIEFPEQFAGDPPHHKSPPSESPDAAHIEDYIRRVPLQRTGTGDDIADAVSFLAHSNFITGQVLPVDGGRTLV